MWGGYGLGTLAGCLVFPFYLFSDSDAKTGFIGPALGGIAGVAIAGFLSYGALDPEDQQPRVGAWKPPVDISLGVAPRIEAKELNMGSGFVDVPMGTLVTGGGTF